MSKQSDLGCDVVDSSYCQRHWIDLMVWSFQWITHKERQRSNAANIIRRVISP
jgi:hypothetical protein